jgi:hypothetical protein
MLQLNNQKTRRPRQIRHHHTENDGKGPTPRPAQKEEKKRDTKGKKEKLRATRETSLRGDAEWDLIAPPSCKYLHLEGVKFGYEGEKERRVAARFRLERRESLQKLERESRGKILSKVALVCVALLLNVIVASGGTRKKNFGGPLKQLYFI